MEKILDFFISKKNMRDTELRLKTRLFVLICFLSILFTSFILFNQEQFGEIIVYVMCYLIFVSGVSLFILKLYGNLKFLGNFYSFNSWATFSILIMASGGVMSSAFQWLIISIIPAYIFTPLKNGHLWFFINLLTAIAIVYLSNIAAIGIMAEVSEMEIIINSAFGIGLIIFVPIMVIFYGLTNESIKAALKSSNFDLLEQEKLTNQSEQKFRVIAENFPNGSIAIIDRDYIARGAYGSLVARHRDLVDRQLHKTMIENLGEEEFYKRKIYYDRALNGETCSFESEYLGEYYFNSVSPLKSSDGSINRFIIASQVISDLKEAEKEIEKNQYLLRKIIDSAPIFISRIDKDGYYLIINDTLSKVIGIPSEEAVGKHFTELIPKGMLANFTIKFEEIKTKSRIESTSEMWLETQNRMIYNHYIMSQIKDDNGNFDGVVIVGIDVTNQKEIENSLRVKNSQINESIQYATRIQNGVLGNQNEVSSTLRKDSFVFFQPKDVLSGDFYWCAEWNNKQIVIAGDCTGHGVPGALMTIIGINFINEIVYTYGMTNADMILYQLDRKVTDTLINKNSKEKIQDGMDMSVLVFDRDTNKVSFSGAKNPLFICRKNGECERIRGTKYPIGSTHYGDSKVFENHEIDIKEGDMLYIYSDGYQDQMGDYNGKKYMAKNFRNYLETISELDVSKQKILLEKSFNEWKSNREQTDDVLVIGIRY